MGLPLLIATPSVLMQADCCSASLLVTFASSSCHLRSSSFAPSRSLSRSVSSTFGLTFALTPSLCSPAFALPPQSAPICSKLRCLTCALSRSSAFLLHFFMFFGPILAVADASDLRPRPQGLEPYDTSSLPACISYSQYSRSTFAPDGFVMCSPRGLQRLLLALSL